MMNPDEKSIRDIARELWLERLAAGHPGVLTVVSGSMSPMLRLGDSLRVVKSGRWHPPGALIVFSREDKLICHRLMWPIGPGRYLQKGDLESSLEIVEERDIIGVAREIVVENRIAVLYGPNYHYHNTCVWFLVAVRDLLQYLGKTLKFKGMHTLSTQVSRWTTDHIESIRLFEDKS